MSQATRTGARIRVVIADTTFVKSAMVRHRLENDGFDIVATPADGVVGEVRFRQPDAAILGQGLIDAKGADTLGAIRAASPATRVIVVSPSGAVPTEGADGYLEEQASVATLAGLLIDLCGEPTIVLPEAVDSAAETAPIAALLAEDRIEAIQPRRGSSTGSGTGTGTGGGSGAGGGSSGGGGGGVTDTFPGQGTHAGWSHKSPKGGWHGDKPK